MRIIIFYIMAFIAILLISFLVFSGLVYLIFLIFGLTFSFKTSLGLYLILFAISLFIGGGK